MTHTDERIMKVANGWPMLFFNIALVVGSVALLIVAGVKTEDTRNEDWLWLLLPGLLLLVLGTIFFAGHFTLQPNEARVLILFGEYRGTVTTSGFFWTNPFYTKKRISRSSCWSRVCGSNERARGSRRSRSHRRTSAAPCSSRREGRCLPWRRRAGPGRGGPSW